MYQLWSWSIFSVTPPLVTNDSYVSPIVNHDYELFHLNISFMAFHFILGPDESPMMCWGEIEGTPFRFDATDTPVVHKAKSGPQFRIPDVPKRDQIGLQLAEQASKAHRDKKEQALKQAAATFNV